MNAHLSSINWLEKMPSCRYCRANLKPQADKLVWKETQINQQLFFHTTCPVCQNLLYFWKSLSDSQYFFKNKLHIVLLTPEIPGNVGTIIRLACAFNLTLHLIEPFGFIYSEKWLRRSSANHFHLADTHIYSSWDDFRNQNQTGIFLLTSSKAKKSFTEIDFTVFEHPIFLIFGKESTGLPDDLITQYQKSLFRIPQTSLTSSINLGHAVAICSFFVRYQYHNFDFTKSI